MPPKFYTFFDSFLIFGLDCRHLFLPTTVDNSDIAAHAYGCPRRIHSHVATTDDTHALTLLDRHHLPTNGSLVEGVDLVEQISRLADSSQFGARDIIHVLWDGCSRTHKNGIISFGEEFVNSDAVGAHKCVVDKVDSELGYLQNFRSYYIFGQPVFRNTPHQDSARLRLTFIDGHGKTLTCQIAGHRQSGRSGTDDRNTPTGLLWHRLTGKPHLRIEISDKRLDASYLDWISLSGQHAMSLALLLMGTDAPADGWEVGDLVDRFHGST